VKWLHSLGALSGTLPTATALLSSLALLLVRVWTTTTSLAVTKRASIGLDVAIIADCIAFLFFVLVRFVNLG
jgi:hypothetical protein